MPSLKAIFRQIEDINSKLIRLGLSVAQNPPSNKNGYITYSGMQDVSVALKNIAYDEIYKKLDEDAMFDF